MLKCFGIQKVIPVTDSFVLCFQSSAGSIKSSAVIEKTHDALTKKEVKQHWSLVRQALRKELQSFIDLKTIEMSKQTDIPNLLSSRWVLRWKEIDGKRSIKARLVIRGYEDQDKHS